ncbi:MAG: DUF4384 domain-containing protein [Silicimonas sp.]|nr:DUF4384 domain-containing protein [Silicimonas sp.]
MNTRSLILALTMAAAPAMADDRALLIGIDDYSRLDNAPSLNGAVGDTQRMAEALTSALGFQPETIVTLTDSAATYDAVLTGVIDRLVGETAPGDRVVFYFAGHGTTLADGTPALLAHDADSVLGKIPVTVLSDMFDLIADREVTVILDTGFDGGPIGARGVADAVASAAPQFGGQTALWTATSPGQFAWEDVDRGAFTDAFTDVLITGEDDATELTNADLLRAVSTRLAAWCDTSPGCAASGRGFQPQFSGDGTRVVRVFDTVDDPEPQLDPLVADDGAPASYKETLGFVTDLFAPSNDARLTLAINGGDSLRVGNTVSFTATSERPGTLLLLDVAPTGDLAQVYPSALVAEGGTQLSPGQPLTIPNALGANGRPLRIRVTEPVGQGLLLGLFIEGDLPRLTGLMPAGISGGPVPNAGQSLFEISQRLLALEADPDTPIAWSATYLPYRIQR